MNKFKKFMNELAEGDIKKSELKDFIHANGFFSQSKMNLMTREEAQDTITKDRGTNATVISTNIPEGDSIYIYEGIISQQYGTGTRNRNGYKIDKNGWKLEEYMYNSAILLMHDTEKGVIGNMVKLGAVKEGLKGMFWVDINNISDEGIKNQIRTGTLKATSTGSLVDEYKLEDATTGKNYTVEKAEEIYGEWEVFLAHYGASEILIMNVTSTIMLETSLVTIGSNYKAVSNTIDKYFSNVIENTMTPEEIKALKLKNLSNSTEEETDAVAVATETQEGANPEGETETSETTPTENVEEKDVIPEVEAENAETPEEEVAEGTEVDADADTKEPEEKVTVETTVEVETEVDAEPEKTPEEYKAENELLKAQLNELQVKQNTPVINTSLSKTIVNQPTEEVKEKSQKELSKDFFTNKVRPAKV